MTITTTTTTTIMDMLAAVVHTAGPPSMLKLERLPIPIPGPGEVLIRVRAAGLNRSEMFTRQGHSPSVSFPRVLGIEAVGLVEACPSGKLAKGSIVATAMGGLGRAFDGGYAQYTCVPVTSAQTIYSAEEVEKGCDAEGAKLLPWSILGAMPEMLQTAYGCLTKGLQLKAGDRLLIRGGTSSVGLTAAALAKDMGATVWSTTRSEKRSELLKRNGVEHVIVDDGRVGEKVKEANIDKCLELIGTKTLLDSLGAVRCPGGIVCMAGILGDSWTLPDFNPMESIPSGVLLTAYSGGTDEFQSTPLHKLAREMAAGRMRLEVGTTLPLQAIVEAHTRMEQNTANGKIVLLID